MSEFEVRRVYKLRSYVTGLLLLCVCVGSPHFIM